MLQNAAKFCTVQKAVLHRDSAEGSSVAKKNRSDLLEMLQNSLGIFKPLIVMLCSRKDTFQYVGV